MKKFILLLVLFCASIFSIQAESNEKLILKADSLYKLQMYDSAINVYQSIVKQGFESDKLYYNLGNAYFKNRDNSHAILYFEKAFLLNPNDEDIQYNIGFANNQQIDKIDVIYEGYMKMWFQTIYRINNVDTWAFYSILFFVCFLILVFTFLFTQNSLYKRIAFYVGIINFAFCIFTFSCAKNRYNELTAHQFAIVMEPSVGIKTEPLQSGKDLTIIHGGLKVRIIKSDGDWCNIRLSDGKEGWILKEFIEEI